LFFLAKYDKYGRRMNQSQNDLQKFYELDDDQKEEKSDDNKISETGFLYEAENSMDETKAVSRLEYLNKMARGELNSGSESSGSEAEDDVESQASGAESEEDIPMGEETRRFAVLNCDWSRIRAVDIFALCQVGSLFLFYMYDHNNSFVSPLHRLQALFVMLLFIHPIMVCKKW
jgi:hypothetical protein